MCTRVHLQRAPMGDFGRALLYHLVGVSPVDAEARLDASLRAVDPDLADWALERRVPVAGDAGRGKNSRRGAPGAWEFKARSVHELAGLATYTTSRAQRRLLGPLRSVHVSANCGGDAPDPAAVLQLRAVLRQLVAWHGDTLTALTLRQCGVVAAAVEGGILQALHVLERLDLSYNEALDSIDALPPRLKSLNVEGCCRLTRLRLGHDQVSRLEEVRAARCRLVALPPALLDAPTLRVLDVAGNDIVEVPDAFGARAGALSSLRLAGNVLAHVPPTIAFAAALTGLSLTGKPGDHAKLASLPVEVALLVNLRTLAVAWHALTELPNLSPLDRLQSLDASHNRLTLCLSSRLPTNLTTLSLSDNLLQEIDDGAPPQLLCPVRLS